MANILDLVKEVEKMNVYQDTANKLKQGEFTPKELKASYLLEDKAIKAESKIPKTILEIFGEKSKDADDMKEETQSWLNSFLFGPESGVDMGYAPDLALSPLISKQGIMATLKNLLGRAKSKSKFPVGYGEPTRDVAKKELEKYFLSKDFNDAIARISDPTMRGYATKFPNLVPKLSKRAEDWMEVQKALKKMETVKPKGMRQFGKFNRQKWEK
jgi:hypothetical protein|tara:strand:- start:226 stop:867 length:642 start_codon:yes stop_codon:yes gene_type:complete